MTENYPIIKKVFQTIYNDSSMLVINPSVDVDNGRVVISGAVDTHWKKAAVEDLIKTEVGVPVENHLEILPSADLK